MNTVIIGSYPGLGAIPVALSGRTVDARLCESVDAVLEYKCPKCDHKWLSPTSCLVSA